MVLEKSGRKGRTKTGVIPLDKDAIHVAGVIWSEVDERSRS